jgi:lactoylglutathione lyase
MAKLIHSMVRVLDESKSVRFYEEGFGLNVCGRYVFETFTIVYMSNTEAEFELELTVNHGREQKYNIGDGYGHIAFVVENLAEFHRKFADLGMAPTDIKELKRETELIARFFFVQDPDDYKIEVLQRHGRYH